MLENLENSSHQGKNRQMCCRFRYLDRGQNPSRSFFSLQFAQSNLFFLKEKFRTLNTNSVLRTWVAWGQMIQEKLSQTHSTSSMTFYLNCEKNRFYSSPPIQIFLILTHSFEFLFLILNQLGYPEYQYLPASNLSLATSSRLVFMGLIDSTCSELCFPWFRDRCLRVSWRLMTSNQG